MLVIYTLTHTRLVRNQINSINIKALHIFIEVIMSEYTIQKKFINFVVVGCLISISKTIPKYRNIALCTWRSSVKDLSHTVSHYSINSLQYGFRTKKG